MKKYPYKGGMYTLKELEVHPDCRVAGHELRRNIWRKKLPIEEAMVKKIKLTRSRARKTYFHHGLELTVAELSELPECKVTYYQLHKLLQKKVPVDKALQGKGLKYCYTYTGPKVRIPSKFKTKYMKHRYLAQGSQISFNPPPPPREDLSYTYEWLVLERLGFEMNKKGINLEKTIGKIME